MFQNTYFEEQNGPGLNVWVYFSNNLLQLLFFLMYYCKKSALTFELNSKNIFDVSGLVKSFEPFKSKFFPN